MLLNVFNAFPHTFSFGEGLIVCQAFSSALLHCVLLLIRTKYDDYWMPIKDGIPPYDFISLVAGCCLLTPVLVYIYMPPPLKKAKVYYTMTVFGLVCGGIICLGEERSFQIVAFDILTNYTKIALMLYWIFVAIGSITLVLLYNKNKWSVTSIDRKYFHALAIMIFLPGILSSPELTKLASIGAFLIFIVLEFIRSMKLPPYGKVLDEYLRLFLDKQDSGSLILTHIYLLSGCSLPLWLTPASDLSEGRLELYSGIISLGVGDSCASIIGSRFGKRRYPGSKKTMEGTLAAWMSMTCFTCLMVTAAADEMLILSFKLMMVAMLESFTEQVDNLVLPLYTYALLSHS